MKERTNNPVNWKKELKLAPGYIILTLWVIFTFVLIGWILFASLSTTKEIFSGNTFKFQSGLHFENYAKAWTTHNVSKYFMNSVIYTIFSCALVVVVAAPAAYVLSRFKFKLNKFIQSMFVSALGLPSSVIVPMYRLIIFLLYYLKCIVY